MKVIIRYPERKEVLLQGGRKLGDVLKDLRLNPETVIALRGTVLLTHDVFLDDSDVIEVRSAISGG